jgi:hypothetical protein
MAGQHPDLSRLTSRLEICSSVSSESFFSSGPSLTFGHVLLNLNKALDPLGVRSTPGCLKMAVHRDNGIAKGMDLEKTWTCSGQRMAAMTVYDQEGLPRANRVV